MNEPLSFEDFCAATDSVRHGIPVGVPVLDAGGTEVFAGGVTAAAGVVA